MTTQPGRYLVPVAIMALAVCFVVRVHEVLLPFVLAATMAYLLNPLVRFFEVRGIQRRPAAVFVFILMMGAVMVAVYLTISIASEQVSRMTTDAPLLIRRFKGALAGGASLGDRIPLLQRFLGNSNLLDMELGNLFSHV